MLFRPFLHPVKEDHLLLSLIFGVLDSVGPIDIGYKYWWWSKRFYKCVLLACLLYVYWLLSFAVLCYTLYLFLRENLFLLIKTNPSSIIMLNLLICAFKVIGRWMWCLLYSCMFISLLSVAHRQLGFLALLLQLFLLFLLFLFFLSFYFCQFFKVFVVEIINKF